tara:strand:- start:848 stop:1774 length:927 start_codon:yes stop_codon:yes gene_type:complete
VHGLPGGGKTYVANLFLKFLREKNLNNYVLRVHFQEFMSMVHDQVNRLRKKKSNNPLDIVGKELSKKYKLICFDELEIIDIADAMIVSKLFSILLEKKISFIITSNFKPNELYKYGLQREQFIPFIEILKKKMCLINIKNNCDLRFVNKEKNKSKFFLHPLNSDTKATYLDILKSIKKNYSFKTIKLKSLGRDLVFNQTIDNILFTDFKFLCSYKFSPNDYIAVSNFFDWFFIDNIPVLNTNMMNESRKFITLIDVLYEKKSKLVIRAENKLENIFVLKKNKDLPFLRTVSRITEMTSQHWIGNSKKG